ncbi:helix-turn-helix transcriptional regulator [Thermus thalpophilus]|uniref:helix-turn-helix transcriptional regulator n=1 Tax=Thermus thalpophilus TaxID=2908147 RepID=UPI001FAABF8B|nr:helix-turn-helix transcriptional regulator [Thermus thalpophilus]
MKRKLVSVDEFFKDDLDTPSLRQAYREVLDEELGKVLKALREKRGLNQKDLAERMGVHRSRIAQIENAEGLALSLETLVRFASVLGYRVNLTFTDEAGAEVLFPLSEVPAKETGWGISLKPSKGFLALGKTAA